MECVPFCSRRDLGLTSRQNAKLAETTMYNDGKNTPIWSVFCFGNIPVYYTNQLDYLIKLKARHYPFDELSTSSVAETDAEAGTEYPIGGNYLVPSLVERGDPGRSWYMTLHQDSVSTLNTKGQSKCFL
jgi:hypothetical protein